jgi:hypothetical protein
MTQLADTEALTRAKKYITDNPDEFRDMPRAAQLEKAGIAIFRADPKLGQRFARLPETVERLKAQGGEE